MSISNLLARPTTKQLTGGVTNQVYHIAATPKSPPQILRVYGEKSGLMIDREKEIKLLTYLNQYGFGPKIYQNYSNYRLEELLPGVNITNLPSHAKPIANTIQQLHQIPVIDDFPNLLDTLLDWRRQAGSPYPQQFSQLLDDIKNVDSPYWKQIVTGHGDLTLGNFLIDDQGVIRLLDFEYSKPLPRAFDLANHLCEYSGIEEISYPDQQVRENLISYYLGGTSTTQDLEIIDKYSLLSHYYWGCWGVIQSNSQGFDYKNYSKQRFKLFNHYFQKFINTA